MLIALLLLFIFLVFIVLLYLKRIAVMLALPLMALLFALVAEVPPQYLLDNVLHEGPVRFAPAILAVIFGGVLALFIKNQGIAEAMVRYAAELGGERPLILALSMMLVTALLFSALGGLGAVIMVGTVILPIMMSVGIAPVTAGAIMLIGLSMGGTMNLGNWQLYVTTLGLPQDAVRDFMIIMLGLYLAIGVVFCAWSLRRSQLHRFWTPPTSSPPPLGRITLLAPVTPLLCVLLLRWPIVPAFVAGLLFTLLVATMAGRRGLVSLLVLLANVLAVTRLLPDLFARHTGGGTSFLETAALGLLVLLPFLAWTGFAIWRARRLRQGRRTLLALLAPVVPMLLIHLLHWDLITAFVAGFLLIILATARHETVQVFTKSMLEGFESVAPAVVLIIGIGMLLAAVSHENISRALQPLLGSMKFSSALPFVVVFGLLAPLALYRGPLNIWGMGSGFAAIMLATGTLRPEAIMAVLASVGAVQGVCDPTNTHNAWIASYTRVETMDLMKRTLVFIWPMSVIALIIAASIYL